MLNEHQATRGAIGRRRDALRDPVIAPRPLYQRLTSMMARLDDPVLHAIRVELYFHLLAARAWGSWSWARSRLYPVWGRTRAMRARRRLAGIDSISESRPARTLMVVENETTAGLGTLMPLLRHPRLQDVTVVATDRVALALRDREPLDPVRLWARMADPDREAIKRFGVHGRYERLLSEAREDALREELESMGATVRELISRAAASHKALVHYFERNRCLRQVVTHNDFMPSTYLATMLARERGLRGVTLQHGMPVMEYAPISTDRYLVWGEWAREWFRGRGAAPQALMIAGCPRMDPLFRRSRPTRRTFDRPRLVILSQTHSPILEPDQHSRVVRLLGEAVLAVGSDWAISVKLHPLETKRLYRKMWPRVLFRRVEFVDEKHDLRDVIEAAAVLVGVGSTAMIEGMILGRPILQIRAGDTKEDGYRSAVPDTLVDTGRELSDRARRLIADQSFREEVLRSQDKVLDGMFANRGRATEAVLEYLL